jgi:Mg-chelatase subunit ChlD
MVLDILVILDRSGSMQDAKADHEGGLRSFITDQQAAEGEALFTLVQFDSVNACEVVFDRVPIREVDTEAVKLFPRGGTPLLDAIGKALAHLSEQQATKPSDQTVVMVITDGEENQSREWDLEKVKGAIAEREKAGATFLYLGANVDAFGESAKLGLMAGAAASFSHSLPNSVNNMYHITSNKMQYARRQASASSGPVRSAGFSSMMSYTIDEQEAIKTGNPVEDKDKE